MLLEAHNKLQLSNMLDINLGNVMKVICLGMYIVR